MIAFNFKREEYVELASWPTTAEELAEYLPQGKYTQMLFQAYLLAGKSPFDAMLETLKFLNTLS